MSDAPHSTPDAPSLDKSYSPADTEEAIRRRWREGGCFHAVPRAEGDDRPPYSILIPPPNVTAALHLGHAFNGTLQDVLVRYHRMRGANTLWMP
ncbi:MAG: class I tRNA ligase family protein, partial [Planctomycetota bacterium]|nr:class I tRNA ligase family protein [Planctomycetota bacterium]